MNALSVLGIAFTSSRFVDVQVSGQTRRYYQHLTRFSKALAVVSDIAMLTLGGELKRKEMLSARLGDVLSHLYLASSILKKFVDDGHQQGDLPIVHYAVQKQLWLMAQALEDFLDNMTPAWLAILLKRWVFPVGNRFKKPSDNLTQEVCKAVHAPNVIRERLSYLCHIDSEGATGIMEKAFVMKYELRNVINEVTALRKQHGDWKKLPWSELIEKAKKGDYIDEEEYERLVELERLRREAISVDAVETL
jgi:acyl-CoA dehydrogenase